MGVQLGAEIIGAGLRRAPLAIKRNNLIEQGKRFRVAAPRQRGARLLMRVPYPPSIQNGW